MTAVPFEAKTRTDTSPSKNESTYEFLDRVSGPVWDRLRSLINQWMADFPDPITKKQLLGNIQSGDNTGFIGALWELTLYNALVGDGYEVTPEPIMGDNSQPDFLVEGHGKRFYLEATVVGDDESMKADERRLAPVRSAINDRVTSTEYFVNLGVVSIGRNAPPIRVLRAELDMWLHDNSRPTHTWTHGEWQLRFEKIRKSQHRDTHRLIGMESPQVAWSVDDTNPLVKALTNKADRYKNKLDAPLLIALGINRFTVDDIDVQDAVCGYVGDLVRENPSATKATGFWKHPSLNNNHSHVASVLTCQTPSVWSIPKQKWLLWRNPNADSSGIPQPSAAHEVLVTADGKFSQTPAAKRLWQVLDLPEDWPGPEPAFPRGEVS